MATMTHGVEETLRLSAGEVELDAHLQIPEGARGLVVVAMGASASRLGRRVQEIAETLRQAGLGTLVADLLTWDEDQYYGRRFDIPCLAARILDLCLYLRQDPDPASLRLGILSTSTGASAAFWGASWGLSFPQVDISAIVSCEGRLDLVEEVLPDLKVPTLLVAGSRGGEVTRMNAQIYSRISAPKDMIVVPGATSVFEESFARQELARWATQWFGCFLAPRE
jgi:putative phosphoribosyl transferase